MAYDDGYYYGQCKIICESETVDDNGRTVAITDGNNTWSAALVDKIAEFMVPGRNQYTVTLLDGDVNKYTTKIEAGYGECIHVMLADGYEAVVKKDFEEALEGVNDRIDGIDTQLNNFTFGIASDGRYGYYKVGADTVTPFLSGANASVQKVDVLYHEHANAAETSYRTFSYRVSQANINDYDLIIYGIAPRGGETRITDEIGGPALFYNFGELPSEFHWKNTSEIRPNALVSVSSGHYYVGLSVVGIKLKATVY